MDRMDSSRNDVSGKLSEQLRHQETLASTMRVAADRNIEFSLVLRLHAKDSMQGVCTREVRQGSYW